MKQPTLAPWAEPIPDAPYPMTAGDLLAWPEARRTKYLPVTTLGVGDSLDLLPGFAHLVADLFL